MKNLFLLKNDITFLNHGSYGACAIPIFEDYQKWQVKLEEQPVQFMAEDLYGYLKIARDKLGKYVGCDGDDLIFVSNPTTAVNTVIGSLKLEAGDEVLSTDHEYGSLSRAWNWHAAKRGFNFIERKMPMPMTTHSAFIDHFWAGVNQHTKIIYMSQITSRSGLIFPVNEICRRAKEKGILTIIDGAHVPAHIPLNLRELGADVYTGACHKWLCAPKGSSFLFVNKNIQPSIKPIIISWGPNGQDPSFSPFLHENQYQGTRDCSAFLAVPAAIKFQADNNWDKVRIKCRDLRRQTRDRIYEFINTVPLCPNSDEWLGQMAALEIKVENHAELKQILLQKYKIEVPIFRVNDHSYLRYSFNAYNDENDADILVEALKEIF